MASGGRLTRKIGIVAVGRAANTLSVYAVYVLVARAWPSAECGLFLAVWVLGNALIPVFLMGLPTSLLYFLPRRENARPLVAQAFACLLVSGLLLVGILFLWGPQLSAWLQQGTPHGKVITSYLQFFLPYVFALVTGGFAESVLIVANRENWLAWLQLVMGTGLLTGGFAALYLGLGPDGVLALFSCLAILRLLAASYLVRRALGAGKGWLTLAGFTELMRYTRPIGLNDAVGSLSRYVDRFVVLYYFAAGATFAEYTLGAFEVPISLLLAGVVSVLVPEISRLFQAGELGEIHALVSLALGRLSARLRRAGDRLDVSAIRSFGMGFSSLFIGLAIAMCDIQSIVSRHGQSALGFMGQSGRFALQYRIERGAYWHFAKKRTRVGLCRPGDRHGFFDLSPSLISAGRDWLAFALELGKTVALGKSIANRGRSRRRSGRQPLGYL